VPIESYSAERANDRPNLVILPELLSIVITSPGEILSFDRLSTILLPRSNTDSISVVFNVILPDRWSVPSAGFSMLISTTSPSIISESSLILTPIDFPNP
jgi:hypothetical protein